MYTHIYTELISWGWRSSSAIKSTGSGRVAENQLSSVSLLLHHEILDSELFELMHQNGDYTHFYFCYRWFLLDFKRGEKWVGLGIMAYNPSTPDTTGELSGVQGQCQLHSKTLKKKKGCGTEVRQQERPLPNLRGNRTEIRQQESPLPLRQ